MPAKNCAIKPNACYAGYFEYHHSGRIDIRAPRCGLHCTSCEQNKLNSFNCSDSVYSVLLGSTLETVMADLKPQPTPEEGLRDFRISATSVRKRKSEYAMELERKEKETKFNEHPRDDGFARPAMRRILKLCFRTKRGREKYRRIIASKFPEDSR